MEFSSELIEIESEKKRSLLAGRSAKVFAGCVFVVLVGVVAFVLVGGL